MATASQPADINPNGLRLANDIITAEEETALIELIEAQTLSYYAIDPTNPRSSISFGWRYAFETDSFAPCPPIPPELHGVCEKAARFAGVAPSDFAECLINRYDPGAIIQPHVDKPVWDLIIGISLGTAATMLFSPPSADDGEPIPVRLPARSIYLMSGDARNIYRHSLPPIAETRWSITLRTLSEAGSRMHDAMRSQAN